MSYSLTRREIVIGMTVIAAVATLPSWALAADDDPVAFVQSLYALPNLWSDVTADDAAIAKYLDPSLGALITENYAKENPEAALDYDPLVQAQDFDTVKADVTVKSQTATAATVEAKINNLDLTTTISLDLVKTDAGWRLANIHPEEGDGNQSLVDELKQLNAAPSDDSGDDEDSGD